jgi:hypothetical protein
MSQVARLTVVLVSLLVLSFAFLVDVPPAGAQSQTCDHLISAPGPQTAGITISAPGTYCLETDVIMAASFTTGNAITIAANYVTLDLNGHKVHGAAAGATTQAVGISAVNRRNVTIKNGTVWGFATGINLEASSPTTLAGYIVEGVRLELNRSIGMYVAGANCIVRNNVVANTGPSAVPNANASGIYLFASGGRVLNNDILTLTPNGIGSGSGIYIISSENMLVVGNRITAATYGVQYVLASTGKNRDNLTSGVGTPFQGGTDAGGND